MRYLLFLLLCAPAWAQTMVHLLQSDWRDAAGNVYKGSCTAAYTGTAAVGTWYVGPTSFVINVKNGGMDKQLLPGPYVVTCKINDLTIGMNWLVPQQATVTLNDIVVLSPSGQAYYIIPSQLASNAPTNNYVITYDDTMPPTNMKWAPQQGGGGLPSQGGHAGKLLTTDGNNAAWQAAAGDVTGAPASMVVGKIQGHSVANTAPTNGQGLFWNNANSRYEPQNPPAGNPAGANTETQMNNNGAFGGTGCFAGSGAERCPSGFISGTLTPADTNFYGLSIEVANDPAGTILSQLAKIGTTGAVNAGTGDTGIPLSIVISASSTTGNALLARAGQATLLTDAGGVTTQHYVGASNVTAGRGKDLGATIPTSGCWVGIATETAAASQPTIVLIDPGCASAASGTITEYRPFVLTRDAGGTIMGNGLLTNNMSGCLGTPVCYWAHTGTPKITILTVLPLNWTGSVNLAFRVFNSQGGSGNVVYDIATACLAAGSSMTPSYNTAQTVTQAVPASNQLGDVSQAALTTTGCVSGSILYVDIQRNNGGGDTYADQLNFVEALLTVSHT